MTVESVAKRQTSASDVLAAIIFFMDVELLSSRTQTLHISMSQIYWLFPLLEKHYSFSMEGSSRFSRELEQSLNILRCSGVLHRRFEDYFLDEKGREFILRNIIPLFDCRDQKELQSVALALETHWR